jgi:acetolactate synthase-1/3 small subunit
MQTIVAYVENKPGVLNRVASLTRRLAINIDSLTVGPTENEEVARMTICAHTDEGGARRLEASLEKLVDVLLAENISGRPMLERDLALIKVSADQANRPHSRTGRIAMTRGGDLLQPPKDEVVAEPSVL